MKFMTIIFALLAGCATGHKANSLNLSESSQGTTIKMSLEENKEMSSDNFIVLEYTIENTGSDFIRIKEIQAELTNEMKDHVKIVVGQDLVNWSEGIKNRIELKDRNFATFMSGLAAVGAAGAALSKDRKFQELSAGVALAGSGILSVNTFQKIQKRSRDSQKSDSRGLIPSSHILSMPLSIPPNLFLKRFAVFYVDNDAQKNFNSMALSLKTDTGKVIKAQGQFRAKVLGTSIEACKPGSPSMFFRRFKISCLAECQQLHPLNRKSCEEAYQRKFGG